MLIIFDLDDTLIDTSGSVISFKLKTVISTLLEAGADLPFEKALHQLRILNQYAGSLDQALLEFLEIHTIDIKYFLPILNKNIYSLSDLYEISLLPDALEVLSELSKKHTLAIVSYGKKEFQYEKMKKAGLDTSIFSRIVISKSRDKRPHYQALIHELGYSPLEVLVCGDRIHRDLSPAKRLGFKTVHMKWGRGLAEAKRNRDVDFAIAHLEEIKGIIGQFASL